MKLTRAGMALFGALALISGLAQQFDPDFLKQLHVPWLAVFLTALGLLILLFFLDIFLSRLSSRQARGKRDDPYFKDHIDELIAFGQCFRDRISLESAEESVIASTQSNSCSMWRGRPSGGIARIMGNESVERHWSHERYDARQHPLFPSFRQHIGDNHQCWKALEDTQEAFEGYMNSYRDTHTKIGVELGKDKAGLAGAILQATFRSVLRHGELSTQEPNLPKLLMEIRELEIVKETMLAQIAVSPTEPELSWEALGQAAKDRLQRAGLPEFIKAQQTTLNAIKQFQQLLSPDALLRKLAADGHCDLCP